MFFLISHNWSDVPLWLVVVGSLNDPIQLCFRQNSPKRVIFAHNLMDSPHQGALSRSHSASSPATWFRYFHQPSYKDLPVHSSVYRKGHSKRSSWRQTECPHPKVRTSSLGMVTGGDYHSLDSLDSMLLYLVSFRSLFQEDTYLIHQVLVAWGYWMEIQLLDGNHKFRSFTASKPLK